MICESFLENHVVYHYDGSFDGFMCCVFESFLKKELPTAIEREDEAKDTVFPVKVIETDKLRAARVRRSIPEKISLRAKELIEECFLTSLNEKEIHMLSFIYMGFRFGARVCDMLENEHVSAMRRAVQLLSREAHHMTGMITFSDYGGILMSKISPKNNILPLIAEHFTDKLSGETFMIYDDIHKIALVHRDSKSRFIDTRKIEPPPLDPQESKYRGLWKRFLETAELEGDVVGEVGPLPPMRMR